MQHGYGGKGGYGGTCYNCGEYGHLARYAHLPPSLFFLQTQTHTSHTHHTNRECWGGGKGKGMRPYGGGGGNRGAIICYTCNEPGHISRECPQQGGMPLAYHHIPPPPHHYGTGKVCYTCGERGHVSRDCPSKGF